MNNEEYGILKDKLKILHGKSIAVYLDYIDWDYEYVARIDSLHIVGVMTRYLTEGEIWGYPYLSFEDVVQKNVEAIIIATKPSYYHIIIMRLKRFCIKNGIELFNVEGEKISLCDKDGTLKKPLCFKFTIDECKKEIDSAEMVVFDFMNVIATSKLINEKDVAAVVCKKTEKMERTSINAENPISAMEIKEGLLTVRKQMVELCKYASRLGKNVAVLNNSSFPDERIKLLLENYGLDSIKMIHKQEFQQCNKRIIYFTNDKGLEYDDRSIYIASVGELLSASKFAERDKESGSIYERIKLGLFASRAFNSPFSLSESCDGRITVETAYNIGYLFCAEYITDFMMWFVQRMSKKPVDIILFGSRDGYLIQELYRYTIRVLSLQDMPDSIYLWISRMVSINMSIYDRDDMKEVVDMFFSGDIKDILKKRFFLKSSDLLPFDKNVYKDDISYIYAHEEKVIKRAKSLRKRYYKYIQSLKLDIYDSMGYFDFAAAGTCQLFLQRVTGKKLKGYYFYRFSSYDQKRKELDVQAYCDNDKSFETNSLFMECVLTAPHATVIDMMEDGKPIFMDENRSEEQIAYSSQMQEAVKDYYMELLDMLGDITGVQPAEREKDGFLKYIYDDYTIIKNKIFSEYVVKDEFMNIESHVGMMYSH